MDPAKAGARAAAWIARRAPGPEIPVPAARRITLENQKLREELAAATGVAR
jgi:hypothetical protein